MILLIVEVITDTAGAKVSLRMGAWIDMYSEHKLAGPTTVKTESKMSWKLHILLGKGGR